MLWFWDLMKVCFSCSSVIYTEKVEALYRLWGWVLHRKILNEFYATQQEPGNAFWVKMTIVRKLGAPTKNFLCHQTVRYLLPLTDDLKDAFNIAVFAFNWRWESHVDPWLSGWPCMHEKLLSMWSVPDGPALYFSLVAWDTVNNICCDQWAGGESTLWPSYSPDLKFLDFCVWESLKSPLHLSPVNDAENLL